MLIAVCSERSSCPCLCSGVDGKSVSRPVGSWNFQGAFPTKRENRSRSTAMILSGWSKRQNKSGVLRGGKSFRDNPRWGSVQNEHDHILCMVSNQSTKSVGFTGKIPRDAECVKMVLRNLLKWSGKSTTHLVTLGKIRYVNQNKSHFLSAVNPSTASCNRMLLVHSRRRLQ